MVRSRMDRGPPDAGASMLFYMHGGLIPGLEAAHHSFCYDWIDPSTISRKGILWGFCNPIAKRIKPLRLPPSPALVNLPIVQQFFEFSPQMSRHLNLSEHEFHQLQPDFALKQNHTLLQACHSAQHALVDARLNTDKITQHVNDKSDALQVLLSSAVEALDQLHHDYQNAIMSLQMWTPVRAFYEDRVLAAFGMRGALPTEIVARRTVRVLAKINRNALKLVQIGESVEDLRAALDTVIASHNTLADRADMLIETNAADRAYVQSAPWWSRLWMIARQSPAYTETRRVLRLVVGLSSITGSLHEMEASLHYFSSGTEILEVNVLNYDQWMRQFIEDATGLAKYRSVDFDESYPWKTMKEHSALAKSTAQMLEGELSKLAESKRT